MTITEMKEALKSGADIIKLFPGSVYGPSVISAFKAPLPQLNIMPTVVSVWKNMAEWFDACDGRRCWWQSVSASVTGDFEKVREVAQAYMEKFKQSKGCRYMGKVVTLGEIMLRLSACRNTRSTNRKFRCTLRRW